MIGTIVEGLRPLMAGRAEVIFGKQRLDVGIPQGKPLVQIIHDRGGSDRFTSPDSRGGTRSGSRSIAVRIVVTGKSTKSGATELQHTRLIEDITDALWTHLVAVCAEEKYVINEPATGNFVENDGPAEAGARYEISLNITRGIKRPAPTLSVEGVGPVNRVFHDGETEENVVPTA
jgi:hypothetical protein